MAENITFRNHLLGSVTDFVESCDMRPLVDSRLLVEFIVSLSKHREEGKKLYPEIYLCQDINKILQRLPDSDFVKIGNCQCSESAVQEILKTCAPLAMGGWCVFVENSENELIYGLFRGSMNVLSISVA